MEGKICVKGLALALGIGWALYLLVLWIAMQFGYGLDFSALLANLYLGFSASGLGLLWGLIWGFVDGLICGAVIAWLYNWLSGCESCCNH